MRELGQKHILCLKQSDYQWACKKRGHDKGHVNEHIFSTFEVVSTHPTPMVVELPMIFNVLHLRF